MATFDKDAFEKKHKVSQVRQIESDDYRIARNFRGPFNSDTPLWRKLMCQECKLGLNS